MSAPLQATLTRGPVGRQLLALALPMVWGLLATNAFNAVDTFFVAQLGERHLTAMGFIMPMVLIVTSLAIGLGAGSSSAISRALGRGDTDRARRLLSDAISLVTLVGVAICLSGWLSIGPLFRALGADEALIPLIRDYMGLWYFGAPFLMLPMITLSAMRAMGHSHIQGVLMVFASVLNGLLDPLLIFGLWGLPRLEMQGAALASLLARVSTLVLTFWVLRQRFGIHIQPLAPWGVIRRSWSTISHVGLPAVASHLIIPAASTLVVRLAAGFGDYAVAGLGVALRIEPLALIGFYALSGVVGPFVGQNHGAGEYHRLFRTLRLVTLFCFAFGLTLAALLWLAAPFLVGLFSDSRRVLEVAVLYLSIVPLSYGAYGLVMSVNAMFNGLAHPAPGFVISFLRVLGVYLPLALAGMWLWQLPGLFIATAAANLLVGALAYLWLHRRLWCTWTPEFGKA